MMITKLSQAISAALAHLKIRTAGSFKPESSDIEEYLYEKLSLHCAVKWYTQARFKTPFCDFFLDMGCLVKPGRAIGVECDGREFHQDPLRDFCRDALILGTGRLACIYRIEAWAIRKRELDWVRLLGALEPDLFAVPRLQLIEELGCAYDELLGRSLPARYFGFISRRVPEMEVVKTFLEFAKANHGISFPELVNRARAVGAFDQANLFAAAGRLGN